MNTGELTLRDLDILKHKAEKAMRNVNDAHDKIYKLIKVPYGAILTKKLEPNQCEDGNHYIARDIPHKVTIFEEEIELLVAFQLARFDVAFSVASTFHQIDLAPDLHKSLKSVLGLIVGFPDVVETYLDGFEMNLFK